MVAMYRDDLGFDKGSDRVTPGKPLVGFGIPFKRES
jgi:hypothetical protein